MCDLYEPSPVLDQLCIPPGSCQIGVNVISVRANRTCQWNLSSPNRLAAIERWSDYTEEPCLALVTPYSCSGPNHCPRQPAITMEMACSSQFLPFLLFTPFPLFLLAHYRVYDVKYTIFLHFKVLTERVSNSALSHTLSIPSNMTSKI